MGSSLGLGIIVSMMDRFSGPSKKIVHNSDKMGVGFKKNTHKMSKSLIDVSRRLDRYEKAMSKTTRTTQKMYVKMGAAGLGANMMGKKIFNALERPIDSYSRLEDGVTSLKVSMLKTDGTVTPLFDKLKGLSTELSNNLPTSANEMLNVAAMGITKGMSAENLLGGGLDASSKFAMVALERNFERAIEMGAEFQDSWNIAPENLNRTLDMVARVKNIGVGAEEMLSMTKRTGGTAKARGVAGLSGLEEMIPFLAFLKKSGAGSTETIGGNVSRLQSLVLGSQVQKGAKKHGLDMQFADTSGKALGLDNLVDQFAKMKGLSDVQQGVILKSMGLADVEMKNIVTTLIAGGREGIADIRYRMQEQASLDKKVGVMTKTFSARWVAFTGTLDTSLGKLGMLFDGPLKSASNTFNAMAAGLGDFAEEYPGTAKFLTYLTAGVATLAYVGGNTLMVLAGLGLALPYAKIGFLELTTNMKSTRKWSRRLGGAMWSGVKAVGARIAAAWNLAATHVVTTAIIGLAIIGVAGLAYAAWQLSDRTTEAGSDLRAFTDSWEGFWKVFKKIAGFVVNFVSKGTGFGDYRPKWATDASHDVDDYSQKNKVGKWDPRNKKDAMPDVPLGAGADLLPKNMDIKKILQQASANRSAPAPFTYSPSIKIAAGAQVDEAAIKRILAEERKAAFAEWERRQKRNTKLAYGGA